ncbi:MAG: hypothetical protein JXR96_07920 [Deltaproteobacteria bacterium]|nr:hypothetical protein [Deltaproteobacteria bacterium]
MRAAHLAALMAALLAAACMQRIPASAGADRRVRAGELCELGQRTELPEGTGVLWRTGDGAEIAGARVEHVWHRPGRYRLEVEVADRDGQRRRDEAWVEVERPPLADALPTSAGWVLQIDRPAEKLPAVPLMLERLLADGKDANAVLSRIREALDFDPFSAGGLVKAGLDPGGTLAMVGLGERAVLVAAVGRGEAWRSSVQRLAAGEREVEIAPCPSDPAIRLVRERGQERPLAAYLFHRGFLWLVLDDDDAGEPSRVLKELRADSSGAASGQPSWTLAAAARAEMGALSLYASREHWLEQARAQQPDGKAVWDGVSFFRADLDLGPDALLLDTRLGLEGPEAQRVAGVLRARNAVPAFRTFTAADQHALVKLSLDLPGFLRAVLELGGEGGQWAELVRSLDSLGEQAGVDLRMGVLDNLGDSHCVELRMDLAAILSAAGGKQVEPSRLVQGVGYFQLRNAARFSAVLDGLLKLGEPLGGFSKLGGQTPAYRLDLPGLPLVLRVGGGMAILATSEALADEAASRVLGPHAPDPSWPPELDHPAQSMVAVDLGRLLQDFHRVRPAEDEASAAMAKAMLDVLAQKVGAVAMASAVLQIEPREAKLQIRLGLR